MSLLLARLSGGTTFTDSPTGTEVSSGSLVQSHVHAPTLVAVETSAPALTQSHVHAPVLVGVTVSAATDQTATRYDDIVVGVEVTSAALIESYVPGSVSNTQSRGPLLGVYYPN